MVKKNVHLLNLDAYILNKEVGIKLQAKANMVDLVHML
jgi:hypothetical protein